MSSDDTGGLEEIVITSPTGQSYNISPLYVYYANNTTPPAQLLENLGQDITTLYNTPNSAIASLVDLEEGGTPPYKVEYILYPDGEQEFIGYYDVMHMVTMQNVNFDLFLPSTDQIVLLTDQIGGARALPTVMPVVTVDETYIWSHEQGPHGGAALTGYVPLNNQGQPFPNSGVTVGYGVDLSGVTVQELQTFSFSQTDINTLQPYLGLKGAQANAVAANLVISQSLANELNVMAMDVTAATLAGNFTKATGTIFGSLPTAAQTAILDVAYQMGANLQASAPNFWSDITTHNWSAAVQVLDNFTLVGITGVLPRFTSDATLLQAAINGGLH